MAMYKNNEYLTLTNSNEEYWDKEYSSGEEVPVSGIYRCTDCGEEVTCNKGDVFPPNDHAHSKAVSFLSRLKDKSSKKWMLIIQTNTTGIMK